ncbi:MAG: NYN domain-containing protein, partial [Anaerolineae bacterium]|nr:NYN domain-containing protein [Anaerolineae bacterium]
MPSARFTKGLIEFAAEIRFLQHQAPFEDSLETQAAVKRHRRLLQKIYERAERAKIDLTPHSDLLVQIETGLKMIEAELPPPVEKIAIFIDAANFSKTFKSRFAQDIDYEKLLTIFSVNAVVQKAYYYTGVDDDQSILANPFFYALRQIGYQLVTKPIKTFPDGGRKGNLDIEIALDMLELADKVDRVILFSGDGDFAPLLKRVGQKGVKTEVVSYIGDAPNNPTAWELVEAADKFTDLASISEQIVRVRKYLPIRLPQNYGCDSA